MEKGDKYLVVIIGLFVIICSIIFDFDYELIADSGLTLSSIVLAVYMAAIIGLINSELAQKMAKDVSPKQNDKTQLGVITHYFKLAIWCAIFTIIISSLVLFLPVPKTKTNIISFVFSSLHVAGFLFYAETILFLAMISRFILNRQIWNK